MKSLEIFILSKLRQEGYTTTIYWENINELKVEVDRINSISESLFDNKCYWEWDEDECSDDENDIINS